MTESNSRTPRSILSIEWWCQSSGSKAPSCDLAAEAEVVSDRSPVSCSSAGHESGRPGHLVNAAGPENVASTIEEHVVLPSVTEHLALSRITCSKTGRRGRYLSRVDCCLVSRENDLKT